MTFDFDPEKPEKTLRSVPNNLDLLETLFRDCPKKGVELTPGAAAALVETFTAMAKAMQQVEGLTYDVRLRLKKTNARAA